MNIAIKKGIYLSFLLVIWGSFIYAQQSRYALVIGIKSYQNVPPLQNSLNDAMDMSAILKKKGFTVVEVFDPPDKRTLREGIVTYLKVLEGKSDAVGLVFYAGHGIQMDGNNYLIPATATLDVKTDLDDQCINMNYILGAMDTKHDNGLNVFILDACRNNPFKSFSRSGEKGLSVMHAPQGSYIVYSTKPGFVASDGSGRNGLFTSKLLKYIDSEGLTIEQIFKSVARDVSVESANYQRPWISSDYTGDFYFTPSLKISVDPSKPVVHQPPAAKPKEVSVTTGQVPLDYGYGTADARVVNIGSQVWIAKNLNIGHFRNGDPIPEIRDAAEWVAAGKNGKAAWCYYDNNASNGLKYGRLYNWYAVSDPRGLCPEGWHIPSDAEWSESEILLGGKEAGMRIKAANGWSEGGNGTNDSGFSGLPAGGRCDFGGNFSLIGDFATWWSSNELNKNAAYSCDAVYFNGHLSRDEFSKGIGYSVRCIKD